MQFIFAIILPFLLHTHQDHTSQDSHSSQDRIVGHSEQGGPVTHMVNERPEYHSQND